MRFFVKRFTLLFFIKSFEAFSSPSESYIDFTTHNIGQGNCMTVHLFEVKNDKHSYILVDGGSNAYKKDVMCQEYFKMQSENQEKLNKKSQPRMSTVSPIPSDFKKFKEEITSSPQLKLIESNLIKLIRSSLGESADQDFICVKTVFISHPDTDHYNWIPKIFYYEEKEDQIKNVILGGLPESYNCKMQNWLNQIILRGVRVYFPSIKCPQPAKDSLNEILENSKKESFADQMYSDPINGWLENEFTNHLVFFKKALPWGSDIKTYLLTVNPTHTLRKGKVRRGSLEDDNNSDSLIINFRIGNYSLIITGDATNVTTKRVLENYEDDSDFFETQTILTADHHGSYTHVSLVMK